MDVLIWSSVLSLWSLDSLRLLRQDSDAIPKVEMKLAIDTFSLVMYSNFTRSFWWTVAGGLDL